MAGTQLVKTTRDDWILIQAVAPVATASRMFGVTEEQAAIVMLKAHELGLGLAAAFEFVHVIQERPSLAPKGALALIHRSGLLAEMKILEEEDQQGAPVACTVTMKRADSGFAYTVQFSMSDAEAAGLVKPGSNWISYPRNMLRWRAIGYCADIVFPDLLGGMYRPEEVAAIEGMDLPVNVVDGKLTLPPAQSVKRTAEPAVESVAGVEAETAEPEPQAGAVAETEAKVEKASPEAEPTAKPASAAAAAYKSVTDLVAKWPAEQVMAANEGKIPATPADCQRVAARLLEQD